MGVKWGGESTAAALTLERGRRQWRGRILGAEWRSDGGGDQKSNEEGGVLPVGCFGVRTEGGREPKRDGGGRLTFERRRGEAREGWGSGKSGDVWREKGHE
jgi:hypothetical protein